MKTSLRNALLLFSILLTGLILVLDLAVQAASRGEGVAQNVNSQTTCAPGLGPSGYLGYDGTECHGCTISGKHIPGEPDMEFDSEPILSDIRPGGPAVGKLQEKDVLVAIDDQPITTRAAAIQLSWLEPGRAVRLAVRRNGVLTNVEITPATRCRRITQPRIVIVRGRVWL